MEPVRTNQGTASTALYVFKIFLLSRILVGAVLIACASAQFIPAAGWSRDEHSMIVRLNQAETLSHLRQIVSSGDAHIYLSIARNGYDPAGSDPEGMRNWVFFPLYPLLVRGLGLVFGHEILAGLLLSNAAFLVALIALHRLVHLQTGDEGTAKRAVLFFGLNPMSYFFSLPVTESLFAALFLAAICAVELGRVRSGAILMCLATACRPTGLLLLPAFGLVVLRRTSWAAAIIATAIASGGLFAYASFLYTRTGDPLMFIRNQAQWNRAGGFSDLFRSFDPSIVATGWNFVWLNAFGVAAALVIGAVSFRRRRYAESVAAFLPAAALLSSGTVLSAFRVLLPVYPLWSSLGEWARAESRKDALVCAFAGLLALLTACFALGVNTALI